MKNKILILIIGILIGAIITTSVFLIYNKTLEKNSNQPEINQINENRGEPPSIPNGNGGTQPEKPSNLNNNNV